MATTSDLGSWRPLTVSEIVRLLDGAPLRWWFTGGLALELHLGASWREHADVDVGVVRAQVPRLRRALPGWDLQVAAAGRLSPYAGGDLSIDRHENNLWARPEADGPWRLDVTVSEADGDAWVYRRRPEVRLPWADAVLTSPIGARYLAPELQLLYKSTSPRPKDEVDARVVMPVLSALRRERLARLLPSDHPWQSLVRAASRQREHDVPHL